MPHRFKKGVSGNPAGKPKGTLDITTQLNKITEELQASISRVEKIKNKKLLDHFVERAFEDDKVLIACTKKIMPDLIRTEGDDKGGTRVYILQPVDKDGKPLAQSPVTVQTNGSRVHLNGNGANGNGAHK